MDCLEQNMETSNNLVDELFTFVSWFTVQFYKTTDRLLELHLLPKHAGNGKQRQQK